MAKSRQPLKEKFVQIYESLFQGDDPSVNNANFWDELFLLKVNVAFLEQQLSSLSREQLVERKEMLNTLFYRSVLALHSENRIRALNAIQTLCALVQGVSRGALTDIIDILVGFEGAEATMQDLIELICRFLMAGHPNCFKSLVLRFLLVLATTTENVSNNTLLEYIMMNSVFEAIVQLLADKQMRMECGYDALLLLTILVSYRKYEAANPYIVKLSIVDNELALNGYGQVVSTALSELNREAQLEPPAIGLLSTVANMVGSMFVPAENVSSHMRSDDAVLLALYEAVHLNRNFITVLTNSQTECEAVPAERPDCTDPSNLLVTFLEFCSIVMQKTKDESSANTTKLAFIILLCITEDQYANSMMHDVNMVFKVQLHRMPMRHRSHVQETPSRPLACALLDLMVEFVLSHMRKNLLLDLYQHCLAIVHRLLCYQKKCRVRLQYSWKELWTALISLLKFLVHHETDVVQQHNIFQLASQVVNIFNLFITYGDTFLPTAGSYDELYYEVIRMHHVFDSMYSMALRYTSGELQWKESAAKLTNHLVNVRAIINHFTPKIDSWSASNHLTALTEEQVLDVVRCNYDTLTLKLQDNLDQYERYSEKPKETAFFLHMVRHVVAHFKSSFRLATQDCVLRELSTIA
ncbi:armadillo-like helical domain-containing protein 3 isoform X2 [Ornithodoros turicata]